VEIIRTSQIQDDVYFNNQYFGSILYDEKKPTSINMVAIHVRSNGKISEITCSSYSEVEKFFNEEYNFEEEYLA